jgi:hypothetical protein
MLHSTTDETPLRLTYGTEAVSPIELGDLSWRIAHPLAERDNSQALREEFDVIDETRSLATMTEAAIIGFA